MTRELGETVWIPCDVRRGAFPDERSVTIDSPTGHWAGFVDVRQLREDIADGRTAVRATVVKSAQGGLAARLPGQTMRHQYLSLTET